ncbi:hypothetical protein BH23PLA1_BH23PLA1_00820 [soil metagenome]
MSGHPLRRQHLSLMWLPGLFALSFATTPARSGEPIHHRQHHHPARVVVGPGAYPIPTAGYRPQALGTFRSSPTLYVSSGYSSGGAYTPAGLFPDAASMAVYGPTSILRPAPTDVIFYGRGYDGRLYPTASGTAMTYPGLSPWITPKVEVNPVRNRINYAMPSVDPPRRERLGPFPLREY